MSSATKTISYRYDAHRNRTLMIDPESGRTTNAYAYGYASKGHREGVRG